MHRNVSRARRLPVSTTGGILRGWLISLTLHSLLVGTALVVAADWNPLPRRKVFQWDVTIIQTHPSPFAAEVPSSFDMAPESPPATSESEPTRPVAPPLESSPSADNTAADPATISEVSHPSVPLDHDTAEIVVDRARQTVRDAVPKPAASSPAPRRHTPIPRDPTNVQPQTSVDDPVPLSTAGQADLPPPEVDPEQDSPLVQEPAIQDVAKLVTRPPAQERAGAVSRPLRADYGWLADALHVQVERLKRYPYLAKSNRWQGNVVLEAVIQADGSISDITVVQSSGYTMLDQDAVALLHRASPVSLAHPLGRPQVVVQIPIGYRLE